MPAWDDVIAIGERFPHPLLAVRGGKRAALIEALRGYEHAVSVFPFGDELHYSDVRSGLPAESIANEVRGHLVSKGFADADVHPIAPGIEDTFMALMGAPPEAAA